MTIGSRMKQTKKRFESVWVAIEDTPGAAEAMKVRAQLLRTVQKKKLTGRSSPEEAHRKKLTAAGMSQAAAAKLLKVTQPRLSGLMRGKIGLFSAEMLIDILRSLGTWVKLSFRQAA